MGGECGRGVAVLGGRPASRQAGWLFGPASLHCKSAASNGSAPDCDTPHFTAAPRPPPTSHHTPLSLAPRAQVIAHGNRQCPICRAPIREADLFDACSEEEARLKERAAHAGRSSDEYGSKVGAGGAGLGRAHVLLLLLGVAWQGPAVPRCAADMLWQVGS